MRPPITVTYFDVPVYDSPCLLTEKRIVLR